MLFITNIYISMDFKKWFERFSEPLPLGDPARRSDLIRGGLNGCENVPIGMRPACQPTTSAFPTYRLPKKSRGRLLPKVEIKH